MKHRAVARLTLTFILASFLGACSSSSPSERGKTTIAVIPKGTSHVFWQSIHAGAARAAQEFGVDIIWRGPLREDDRASQIAEVEGFITRGVSALSSIDNAAGARRVSKNRALAAATTMKATFDHQTALLTYR